MPDVPPVRLDRRATGSNSRTTSRDSPWIELAGCRTTCRSGALGPPRPPVTRLSTASSACASTAISNLVSRMGRRTARLIAADRRVGRSARQPDRPASIRARTPGPGGPGAAGAVHAAGRLDRVPRQSGRGPGQHGGALDDRIRGPARALRRTVHLRDLRSRRDSRECHRGHGCPPVRRPVDQRRLRSRCTEPRCQRVPRLRSGLDTGTNPLLRGRRAGARSRSIPCVPDAADPQPLRVRRRAGARVSG